MDLQQKKQYLTEAKTIVTILHRWAASGDECGDVVAAGLVLLTGVLHEAEVASQEK